MPTEKLALVEYVGKKPFAVDNVAKSGKVWRGTGDVQVVTDAQAKILAGYADQWKRLEGDPPSDAAQAQAAVDKLKELGADPSTETPAAAVSAASAAAKAVASGSAKAKPKGEAQAKSKGEAKAKSKGKAADPKAAAAAAVAAGSKSAADNFQV